MIGYLAALLVCVAGADELAPRVETLSFHVERLAAIEVPAELEDEKARRLSEFAEKLGEPVGDEEAFNALYRDIDAVRMWLWRHAAAQPTLPPGAFEEGDDAWRVVTPDLTFTWAKNHLAMRVATPAQVWEFAPCDVNDIEMAGASFSLLDAAERAVQPFATGYSRGLTATFAQFPHAPGLTMHLTVNLIGNEIVFELAAQEQDRSFRMARWPKPLITGNTDDDWAVIPLMQGMLLRGNWEQEFKRQDLSNSRWLYMPWWGQIQNGHGVQVILETSDDGGARYEHPSGGPTRIQPLWYSSMGQVRYLRTVRYVFDDTATYVTMAKRYRRFVQERGDFVSLEVKRAETPALDEVIGKPVIHMGSLYHFVPEASLYNKERIEANHNLQTFDALAGQLRGLKESGLDDAYVHLDGWGFYGYDNGHPDVMPVGQEQGGWDGLRHFADTCDELGYLFAVHDQYRDFYFNAVSFDDRLTATRQDGSREEHSTWCGGPQTILSPRFAPEYVRRNHDLFAQNGVKVKGAYLDVFAVVPMEESFQAAHPITRTECGEYRRECFELLKARGYVISSEEPADYLVKTLHLVHHGPYSTFPNPGGGDASGIPVPLFSLVYHDSILLPWEMGDDGGWGIPKGDAGWLHCLLNAGLPYVYPGAGLEFLARVEEARALAERCAFSEMTQHEFLDDTFRKQRTTFADGTQIEVDFDAKTYEIIR
jgi:hypothetical protein